MDAVEKRRHHTDYMREYTRKNAEHINEQRRARRAANLEQKHAVETAWRQAHPDKVKEYKQRDQERHADKYAQWKRDWCARNIEHLRARSKADYKAHKDEIDERIKAAHLADPDKYRAQRVASRNRRRARLASVPQEPIDAHAIYERDGGICGICGKKVIKKQSSLDHIIPLSLGGPHLMSNIRLAHINCNKARGNRGHAQLRLGLD